MLTSSDPVLQKTRNSCGRNNACCCNSLAVLEGKTHKSVPAYFREGPRYKFKIPIDRIGIPDGRRALRAPRATPDEASGVTQACVGADASFAAPGEARREGLS